MAYTVKRVALSIDEKRQILKYWDEHGQVSQRKLAAKFSLMFGREISKTVVWRLINQREKIADMTIADICPTDRFRLQSADVIKFETLLMELINNALSKDRKLYRGQIHTFAGGVKNQMPDSAEVQALVFSDRWWRCFRDAHRLTYRRICGSKAAVITHDIEDRMNEIRAEVALYDKKKTCSISTSHDFRNTTLARRPG